MKDDRILHPRLRLCPFCGAAGAPEIKTSGAIAFVRCNVCRAEGPYFNIDEYLRDDFHDLPASELDTEWNNAMIAARHNAMKAWNGRPWEGSNFPEDLDIIEARQEVIS